MSVQRQYSYTPTPEETECSCTGINCQICAKNAAAMAAMNNVFYNVNITYANPEGGAVVYGTPEPSPEIVAEEEDFFSEDSTASLPDNWGRKYHRLRRASALIGASTVAIDNKIEQAMDLVKSHLMYAVREEVEVLKEQIKELLEKNTQLEYELNILKAAATPETLAKLQQPRHPQPPTSTS